MIAGFSANDRRISMKIYNKMIYLKDIIKRFTPLAKEPELHINRPVRISIAKDYRKHIGRIGRDQLDIAYMGPVSYVKMVEKFGKKPLLARHELYGRSTFYGYIFVREGSAITSIKGMKRKRFAFDLDVHFYKTTWRLWE